MVRRPSQRDTIMFLVATVLRIPVTPYNQILETAKLRESLYCQIVFRAIPYHARSLEWHLLFSVSLLF